MEPEDKGEACRYNRKHMVPVTTPLERTLIPKDMRREKLVAVRCGRQ